MLYVECGYWEPVYADGDEACMVRGGGGWQQAQAILAKAWLPKPEPESPYIAVIRQMADETGVEFDLKDIRFMATYMDTLSKNDAMRFLMVAIQAELDRIAEQQRLMAQEMADFEQEQRLGYSPKKLESAWASLKNRKAN